MLGQAVALDLVFMMVGLLIVLVAMGAGVWIWLRRRQLKAQAANEQATHGPGPTV